MQIHQLNRMAAAAAGPAATTNSPSVDEAALHKAFEALKTYDWGVDRSVLRPIDDAVIVALGDAAARKSLEKRLAAVLETDVSRDAKDVVCRKLRVIGTADCVPALARLLGDKELSHMARYALERIQDAAAGAALRDALPKVRGELQAGIAGSIGARGDTAAAPSLIGLLGSDDPAVAIAAATALGGIATPEAAKALAAAAAKCPRATRAATCDAALRAAEQLAAAGKKAESRTVYQALKGADMPEQVQMAAQRGLSGK